MNIANKFKVAGLLFVPFLSLGTTFKVFSQPGCADCEWVRESFLPEAEARFGADVEDNESVYLVFGGTEVLAGRVSVRYDYTPDALDAGYCVAVADGTTIERKVTRNAHRRGLVDRIENRAGTNSLPSFVYAYDLLGRPVSRNGDSFGYNDRSEVVSAQFGTNGVADLYAYDSIGNRVSSRERGVESSYQANELNEYASISTFQPFSFSTNVLAYDLNGNLLTNGIWSYAFDAKNQLVDVWSNGVWVLSNAYDANARRVVKRTQEGTRYFLYDGWNLIQETFVTSAGETNVSHYVWGKDLSGSFQGAGGVGGLLAVLRNGEVLVPSYDNNGNVIAYSNGEGVCIHELRYDAYGGILEEADHDIDIPFLFSTKYQDAESGLLYYGQRYYLPRGGRWCNRDCDETLCANNLFEFCRNRSVQVYDILGFDDGTIYVEGMGAAYPGAAITLNGKQRFASMEKTII